MLTTKKFKDKVIDLGYEIIIDEDMNAFNIAKKSVVYAIVGIEEQFSTTFRNTPNSLKKIVRQYEDTTIKDRTGHFIVPLKGLDLGGQQYLTFNRVTETFKAMDKLLFSSDELTQTFTKEDLESEFFKEIIGDYLKYVEEA